MAGSPKKKAAKGTKAKGSKASSSATAPSSSSVEQRRPSLTSDAPSADFEAGLLFERFGAANAGRLDALSFQKMWRERDKLQQLRKALGGAAAGAAPSQQQPPLAPNGGLTPATTMGGGLPAPSGAGLNGPSSSALLTNNSSHSNAMLPPGGVPLSFEAGQLFERYDRDHDGRLSRTEFEGLLSDYLKAKEQQQPLQQAPPPPPPQGHSSGGDNSVNNNAALLPPPPPPLSSANHLPPHPYHHEGLTHYNETTGLPLPADAVYRYSSVYGHKVTPIAEAYDRRMHKLQALLRTQVLPWREQLLQLGRRVKVVEDEVRAAKVAIERETLADSRAIIERLRSAEALKLAALEHRMNEVTAEVEGIDRLLSKVKVGAAATDPKHHQQLPPPPQQENIAPPPAQPPVPSGGGGGGNSVAHMLEIIQTYPELRAGIDKIAAAAAASLSQHHQHHHKGGVGGGDVGVSPDDFRRETAERIEVLRRCDRYEEALAVKDQMVWGLLQERQRLEGGRQAEETLRREYSGEVVEWIELSNAMAQEIAALKAQVCSKDEALERLRRDKDRLAAELLATKAAGAGGGQGGNSGINVGKGGAGKAAATTTTEGAGL